MVWGALPRETQRPSLIWTILGVGVFVKTIRLSIAEDSKLSDIVAGLDDPIEYVRNVLDALSKHGGK